VSPHSERVSRNGGGSSTPSDPTPIPVKILVSGGFGVGKTTAIGALSDIPPLTTEAAMTTAAAAVDDPGHQDRKTSTTVALDFGRVTIDTSIVLYMFGTPGQDRFGFMWNDLAEGALGGLVLVDTARLADCFVAIDYFERIGLPFVVAVNQFEGRHNLGVADVRAATDVDPHVPVVTVDARDRESMKRLVLTLLEVLLRRARSGFTASSPVPAT
jgi:uncharacterized protein